MLGRYVTNFTKFGDYIASLWDFWKGRDVKPVPPPCCYRTQKSLEWTGKFCSGDNGILWLKLSSFFPEFYISHKNLYALDGWND